MIARVFRPRVPVAQLASTYRFSTTISLANSQSRQPNSGMANITASGSPPLPPTLAIPAHEDDAEVRAKYRPFLLENEGEPSDWVSQLELDVALQMARRNLEETGSRLKVLVLYGSLRKRYGPLQRGRRCSLPD